MSPTVQTLLIGAILALIFFAMGLLVSLFKRTLFLVFAAIWLAYCFKHLFVGMGHGYTFLQELPFLIVNFSAPAVLAWLLLFKVRTKSSI
jgi:hypothetical protein